MTYLLSDLERQNSAANAATTLFRVRHSTSYSYRREVGFGEHRMLFRPRDSFDQRLVASSLKISPEPAELRWMHDVFGNCVAVARFSSRADELHFESHIAVEHDWHLPSAPAGGTGAFGDYEPDEQHDLAPLIRRQHADPDAALESWALRFSGKNRPGAVMQALISMTYGIREGLSYRRRAGDGTQDPLTTLATGQGTCRDFALLMMEAARSLGSSPATSSCPAGSGRRSRAPAPPTPGVRSMCPAAAGSNLTPPMPLSAVAISSASQ